MKVYIRKNFDNEIASHNFYAAFDGFKQMGFEICYFKNIKEITGNEKEDIVVGYVEEVRRSLYKFNIGTQEEALRWIVNIQLSPTPVWNLTKTKLAFVVC